MALWGLVGLFTAFASVVVSAVCLLVGFVASSKNHALAEAATWIGRLAAMLAAAALVLCCGVLVFCFMTGDISIQYVVQYQSDSSSDFAWLYKLSGLWAGREGSLLFWACVISLFGTTISVRKRKAFYHLDGIALAVLQLLLVLFIGVLLFADNNMPFVALPDRFLDGSGNLTGSAALWGMSPLLEHWAMAIHPPTLFVGYAGLAVPFAYATAALVVGDSSPLWVERCSRATLLAWLFLGLGIGIGAVWAYVVLGWGGYWGWDPVENASLLPWLMGVALIHSFTVYRKRGSLKRWSVACACITFSFVALGAYITRSGLVGSVHGFDGEPVSSALFLSLIAIPLLVGALGLAARWRAFAGEQGGSECESLLSRNAAYCMNNFIMLLSALVLAYMTVSAALPAWLPFGGQTFSADAYNAVARPLGLVYFLILALCPLLSWTKTQRSQLWKRMRIPGLLALALFGCLVAYHSVFLAVDGGSVAGAVTTGVKETSAWEPSWYRNVLAVVGYLVASLLLFTSLFALGRIRAQRVRSRNGLSALEGLRLQAPALGGMVAHLGMAIMLIGLIGSSMFVAEEIGYVRYGADGDTVRSELSVKGYTLKLVDDSVAVDSNGTDVFNTVVFDVYKGDDCIGAISPAMQVVTMTGQQQLHAGVMSFPFEDLFVVYQGVTEDGEFSIDARVNPLIGFVWVGIALLMAGTAAALFARRKTIVSADEKQFIAKDDSNINKAQP